MKQKVKIELMVLMLLWFSAYHLSAETAISPAAPPATETLSLNDVMDRLEARYAGAGFSVRFFQTSVLKAMNISDTATGRIFIKRPGMMRWEYATPSLQIIVADTKDLWIYRPDDNQVMHGAAPEFFGGGKGAGFLSDMSRLRKDFDASLEGKAPETGFHIKLIPKNNTYDVVAIYLSVSMSTYEISSLKTENTYGDETVFELIDYEFNKPLAPALFQFSVPEGAEVLTLEK